MRESTTAWKNAASSRERALQASARRHAGGAHWLAHVALLLLLIWCGWALAQSVRTPALRLLLVSHLPLWVPFSTLIFWRWGWALLHWARAASYRFWVFPRLRKQADRALAERGPITEIAVLLATYKERPNVTRRVISSVVDELGRMSGLTRSPLLIAVTGSDEDDAAIRRAFVSRSYRTPGTAAPELVLLRGADGKRDALAKGLEAIQRWQLHPDGVFVMMDGDTELAKGALTRATPLFRLEPPVAALTTNEHAVVRGPAWFAEWIHLRHGQRHLYNCSIALSGRLLCLTGRYSVYRASVLDDGFVEIVRNDSVKHWLWGRYTLLSGDDKSTWFHLLSQGRRLLYVPDEYVVTHELIARAPFLRAYHNLRRWGGNMVRNSERAIRVGPRQLGWFCFWCLIDQRLTMWTTLVGPTAAAYTLWNERWDLVAAYLLWVLISRSARCIPSWLHGRRLSIFYAPLALLSDWWGAMIKIYVSFFPARQFWLNRGARELDSTRERGRNRDRKLVAWIALVASVTAYVHAVGQLVGAFDLSRDLRFALHGLRFDPGWWLAGLVVFAVCGVLLLRLGVFAPSKEMSS